MGRSFLTMVEGLEETALNWVKTATLQAHRWRFGRATTWENVLICRGLWKRVTHGVSPWALEEQHFAQVLGRRQKSHGSAVKNTGPSPRPSSKHCSNLSIAR